MGYLVHTSFIRQAKWICKIVVIFTLSILLLAPEPVLALNFNGTLQSYISNTKLELDGLMSLIQKLPNQSYETGQTMLTEIGTKLHNIETETGKPEGTDAVCQVVRNGGVEDSVDEHSFLYKYRKS